MTTRQMMYIVIFSTLAIVIGMFEIPVGIIGVKLDLSEVIILAAYLMIGFKNVSFVIILRSVVRILLPAKTGIEADLLWKLLGEVIAIVASYLIVFSYMLTKVITRQKQDALIKNQLSIDTGETVETKLLTLIIAPVITSILLTAGMTLFHTVITMPMYLSGNEHFTIFSLLKDPQYNQTSIYSIIKSILIMFGLVNVVKGTLSPLIFLFIKPQLEKMV